MRSALHGVLGRDEWRVLGLPDSTVRSRIATGRFHRLFPGVVSVVPPSLLRPEGWWRAAVLACGEDAALSTRDGGALHSLRNHRRRIIDITVPHRRRVRIPGIAVHNCTTLRPGDVTVVRGIPVTTIPRTILDLAQVLTTRGLERVIEQAEAAGLFDPAALAEQIAHNRRRPAARRLRALLADYEEDLGQAWSEFERDLRAEIRRAGLPPPVANRQIVLGDGDLPVCPDLQWADARVVVEADSFRWHRSRAAFERDRRNDQRLMLAGWQPVRITRRHLDAERARVIATIVALVRRRLAEAAA